MSRSNTFKICVSVIAMSALAACATTPSTSNAEAEAANHGLDLPKPTPKTIAAIQNASPLEQANFWNQHYNLHPTDLEISLSYIKALAAINSYERASEVAKFTSVSYPDNPDVFMLLGKNLSKNNKPIDAAKAYGKVIELSPYDAAPLAALGGLFDSRGDHETAQIAYRRALALDPNRPATLSNLGLSLTLIGELEQAEEALMTATELPGATAAVRQNYALILGLLGKFDQAREVAAIDAPGGIAERNTDFLRAMIGDNPKLQAIAQRSADRPTAPSALTKVEAVETPAAAPTQAVTSSALADTEEGNVEMEPSGDRQIASTTTSPVNQSGLRLRSRNRRNASGGK